MSIATNSIKKGYSLKKRHGELNDFKGLVQSQLRKVIYKTNNDWTACIRREMLTVTFNCQHLAAYTSGPVIIGLERLLFQ